MISELHYNAVQLSVRINTILALDQEDEVFSFLDAVKGVDFSKYVKPISSINTNSHDRGMLIKTMLFGYMNGINTLSTLVSLCRTNLRYLYLSYKAGTFAHEFLHTYNLPDMYYVGEIITDEYVDQLADIQSQEIMLKPSGWD